MRPLYQEKRGLAWLKLCGVDLYAEARSAWRKPKHSTFYQPEPPILPHLSISLSLSHTPTFCDTSPIKYSLFRFRAVSYNTPTLIMAQEGEQPKAVDKGKGKAVDGEPNKAAEVKKDKDGKPLVNGKAPEGVIGGRR